MTTQFNVASDMRAQLGVGQQSNVPNAKSQLREIIQQFADGYKEMWNE